MIGFVNSYGPGAPRAERRYGRHRLFSSAQSLTVTLTICSGWLGVVGAIVGCLCGIALLLLPVFVALYYWVYGFD